MLPVAIAHLYAFSYKCSDLCDVMMSCIIANTCLVRPFTREARYSALSFGSAYDIMELGSRGDGHVQRTGPSTETAGGAAVRRGGGGGSGSGRGFAAASWGRRGRQSEDEEFGLLTHDDFDGDLDSLRSPQSQPQPAAPQLQNRSLFSGGSFWSRSSRAGASGGASAGQPPRTVDMMHSQSSSSSRQVTGAVSGSDKSIWDSNFASRSAIRDFNQTMPVVLLSNFQPASRGTSMPSHPSTRIDAR